MTVAAYLARYFLTEDRLAGDGGVSVDELRSLVADGLVPAPSYRVDSTGRLASVVFGDFPGTDAAPGDYFHRDTAAWLRRALRAVQRAGRRDAPRRLRDRFERRFMAVQARFARSRLMRADAPGYDNRPGPDATRADADIAWARLMDGTFGICVRRCGSVAAIVRKETLQEALTRESARDGIDADDVPRLAALVAAYAEAAMPFAPPEYGSSSRRRLVEDFGARLRACTPSPATPRAAASRPLVDCGTAS